MHHHWPDGEEGRRKEGERGGGERIREACIAGRALRDGGAMKGGAAKSLGKNEERNRLPWQGESSSSVCEQSWRSRSRKGCRIFNLAIFDNSEH